MKEIELPDGTILEAPDDITPEGVKKAVQNYQSAQSTGAGVRGTTSPVRAPIGGGGLEYTPTREDIQRGRDIGAVALPIVGGAVGGAVGGPVGSVAGSMAGTGLSQAAGLEEPSVGGIAASGIGAALPPIAGKLLTSKPVTAGLSKVAGLLPGVAKLKLDKAAQTVLGDVDKLITTGSSKELWAGFKKTGGVAIKDTPATKAALADVTEEMNRLAKGLPGAAQLRTMVNGLTQKFASNKPLDLLDLDANIKAMGKVVSKFERESGIQLGASKHFLRSMYDDLENAPLTMTVGSGQAKAATLLRQAAVRSTKRSVAKEELLETISGSVKNIAGEGDLLTVHPETVLNRIRQLVTPQSKSFDQNFANAMKDELPEVINIFSKLNKLSQGGGHPGSLVIQGQMASAGGAITGAVVGGPVGAGVGAYMGAQIPSMIENIVLSPAGRAVLDRGLSGVISSGNKAALGNLFQLAYQTARRSATAPIEQEVEGTE